MPDVSVVRHLLASNAALTAVVPATSIIAGRLPPKTPLPALAITHVSARRGQDVAQGASRQRTARVQVTVVATDYPQQKEVFQLVVAALPTVRGNIAGVDVDSILPELEGPDFGDEDASLYMQSYDVIVTYSL